MRDLLNKIRDNNILLEIIDGELKVFASDAYVDPDLIAAIKKNKKELFQILSENNKLEFNDSFKKSIPLVPEQENYPLSSAQLRLWAIGQYEEANVAYNMSGVYEFQGELNISILTDAFNLVLERHEILRTVFRENEAGEPVQVILPPAAIEFNIGYEDFRERKFEDDVNTLIAKELNTSFELGNAPLFRAKLFQTDDHKWIFTYVMHHIIGDGWSMDILIKELLLFYSSKIKGIKALLSPLPIQYKDYAAWQQEQLKGDGLEDHKAYWLNQFSGDLPVLELINEYPRPLVKTYHGGTIERNLDSRVLEGIRRLSQQLGGTLFMGLLSGVTALLHRYSGQDDLIIGSPIAGREHADLDGQIGFYLNTIALRMQFKGEQSYSELFDHVREVTLSAYNHQAYPFDQLIGELAIKRDFSRNALFDVLIDYHDVRESKLKQGQNFDGLIITEYKDNVREVSKFDLTFMFIESEAGLSLLLEYNSDLYSSSRAEQLFSHLEGLLLSAISFPSQALSQLSYLSSSEQAQLLGPLGSGGAGADYHSVLSLFTEQVNAHPEGIAVVDGERSLSYAELDRRSGELAAALVESYGVSSGSLVGIMQDRSLELVISILGVLKSGGAYVPVDPVYPASRKAYIMEDTGLTVLLTQTDYIFDLDYYSGQVFAVDAQLEGLSGGAVLQQDNLSTDLAYVIYTSGSTGRPKGCTLSHGNLSHYIQWANHYYFKGGTDGEKTAAGNFGLYTSLSFDLTVTSIFCALSLGSSLRVYAQQGELTEILSDSFSSLSGIDSIKLTPSHINLLQHLELESSSMLCAIVGGEAVSPAQVAILKKINPAIRIYNEYGPTETTVGCVVKELQEGENVLIGRPISGMSVYLTDSSGGLVQVGVAGEICIAGDGVGSGYLNRAELSAVKFMASPFRIGERMYRSGDLGRWTGSGELEFLGRSDEQVKIRGYRIELGEIESQLQGYAELSEAVVLAQPGSGGEQELVAYLVSDSVLDIHSLRAYLGNLLPAYLIPAHFVQVDAIPLTSNGKADKKQLAAAGGLSLESGTEYLAPRNATEEKLVEIWEEILGKTGIGVLDNFFDLGGHSLTAIRLVSQLHKEFQVKIELKDLFNTVILQDQALLVSGSVQSIFEGITALDLQADYVLSSAQRRLWVLSQFEEGSIAYNIPGTYEFSGELNLNVFYASFAQLISRHEILRTVFKEDAQGEVRQVILPSVDFHVGYQDLRDQGLHSQIIRSQGIDGKVPDQLVEEFLLEPFDLSHGPLLRACLYQLEDQRWVFSYVMHHIISDGWSMEVLVRELLSFYNSGLKGEPALLEPLSIQYKDYAAWQQDQLQGEQLAVHQAYWLEQFSGELPVLELVNEYPRPAVKSYHGGVIERALDPRVLEGIRGLSQQQGGTLFMGLLSGVTALLYRYSGQQDLVIGSPIAGREHADLDGQIGFYLNTLALRMQFDGNQSYQELLSHVREVTLAGYAHQVYPFDELVDALSLKRDFSRNVLFDVLIDYHDVRESKLKQGQNFDGLIITEYKDNVREVSKFDLTFMFIESEAGLRLLLEYNSDLYSSSRAEQLFSHLEGLLLSAISFPSQALSQLSYLSSSEQAHLLGPLGSGGAGADYRPVLSLFTEQVKAHPEDIAVVDGDVSLSYTELDRRSGELAAALVESYGVSSGSLVGIMQDRSLELVISILGVLKSGGAYVPVDPVYPASRKAYIMEDTGLTVLLTQTDYIFDLDYYSGQVFAVDAQLEGLSGGAVLGQYNLSTDLAYVIYTSGSTGQPKGCTLSHGNLSHYIQWANHYYFKGGNDKQAVDTGNMTGSRHAVGNFGLYTSLSFDLTVTSIFCALSLGSSLRVYAQEGELTEILRDSFSSSSGIDSIKLTPSHINLLQHLELESSSMLCAIVGGEAVSPAQVAILKKINPAIRIYNEYGPTETTVGCVVKELQEGENVLIGRPISGMSVYLTDSSGGLVPVGVAGEICIAGDGVGSGYLNRAELSAAKFIASPFRIGERMYRSGDLGRWTGSGELEFLGRSDEQVKIRGYRIELGEIESQLQGYAELSEAVVLAQPGSGGEQELVAYLVSDQVLDIHSLRAYLGNLLPAYLIPAHFVQVDAIPLTSNGKADKKQLAAAGGLSLESGTEYIAPRNVTEEQVAQIWSEVLEKAQVGIRDDFFDLGGDSIKILRMMAGLRRELGVEVPIAEVYRNSTIEGLMAHIGSHEQELAEDQVRHQGEEAAIRAELEELKGRILSELEDHSDIEDVYPMSDIEKGMVFEFLVNKGAGVYHDQMVHQRIFFDFDAERFRYALELLVEKHTILRTSFHLERFEREVQMVHRKIAVKLDYRDLSTIERLEQENQVRAYLEEEMGRPFEVTEAPLWRMAAFNFGKGELIFVFQCHHAIIDGWSDALLMTELNNLYLQLGEIPDYRPAALASNYKDFIVAHELDKRNVEIRDFWQQELSAYTRLDIFSQQQELNLGRYRLDKIQLKRLEAYAKSTHSNVKSVSLSAYLYLLKLLNAGEDMVTGLVTHMRPHTQDSDQMLGCFLNTIPFRMHVSGQEQGAALVQDVYEKLILMKDNERLSMLEISTLHNKQSERGNPFFDVLFDYVDFHAYDHVEAEEDSSASYSGLRNLDIGGIDLTNTYLDFIINRTGAEFYELSIRLTHKLKSGLDADRLAALYFNILDYLISSPAQQLNSSSHLSAPEQVQLLGPLGSGGAGAAYRPVLSLFTEQVNAHPEGIAVVDGDVSLSYAELDRRSGELAAALVESYGVSSGSLVGIMQDRSLELVISILGVLKSGGAYVPVDPVYPASRKAYIMEDTGLTVLLTQTDYIFDLDYYSGQVFAVDAQLEGLSGGAVLGQDNLSTDLAYVIYTSGSTGQPKGCALSHGNLSHYIQWANYYYFKEGTDGEKTAAGNFGLYTSLSFDLTVTSIFCALSLGSSLRVYAQEGELTEILRDSFSSLSGIDSIKLTPSHINLLQHLELESSSMLCAIVGGEAVSPAQVAILKKINPAIRIYNEYGPTETTVGCVVKELHAGEAVLIGRPISGMSVYLTDSSGGLVPVGVAGEICIAGDGVGSGYLNRAELSAAKFMASPFRIGERMYRSGDLGRWTGSGELEFLGRSDEQVKIRGYRIELGEIESQLQGYAELSEAVVLAQPGSGGEQELVAYLVSDQELDIHSLRAYLGRLLPAYLVPAHFVQVDAIPLTSNGKADKKQLAAAGGLSLESGTEYLAPRNATEEKLVEIWEEILGKTGIGVLDNFFDLGGHSLTAIRLVSQLHKEFQVKIELKDLFNTVILQDQALLLSGSAPSVFEGITALDLQADYVLSSAQRRLWILSQFEEGSIAYNIPGTYEFSGELNLNVFYASFAQLISRHEILRTVFKEDAQGEVRQVILPSVDFHVGYQDLRDQGLHGQIIRSQGIDGKVPDQLVEEFLLEPFDLSHGPLLRACLYQLEDQRWVFSYVMHHIISDGWSMEVLVRELLSFYNSGLKGEPALLEPLSIQYKDYAAWQQDQLQGEQLAVHQAYWLEQFSGELPVLELVNEYPRPAVKSYHGGVIERALDPRVLEGIRGLSQQQGGTLFMGLLSGVTALLYRYSGQQDLVIGSPIAGREHADLDGQIGFYLNTLALRMQFDGNQSYQELLSHVREVTLAGYAHQVYPFDELVDALSLKRDFSRNVLFDVLIDYHDLRTGGSQQQGELEGLQVSGYQGSAAQVSKFDLTFMFIESEAGLRLLLEYNSDLYSSSRAEQLFSHLEGLLLSAISFPSQALSQLSYLSSSEQAQLLGPLGSGGAGADYHSVLSLFTEQVNAHPEGIAVVDGDVSLSYAELDRRSGELAAALVESYGVSSGSLVGIMQDRSLELVISILGVLKSGGAYVPVDPVYPASRKAYIMEDTGLTVLLTQTDYIFDLDYYSGQVFAVDAQLEGLSGGAVLGQDNLSTDLAYVIYTSGSTGQPKGCTLSHGNLSHYIQWANHYYFKGGTDGEKTAAGNFGLYTSLSFDLTVTSIFCALSLGSSLRVYAQQGELTEILRDSFSSLSGIDSIKLTPSHINLLQHLELESSSMLCAIVGGEAVSPAQVAILKKINPAIRIYNEYGPTETTVGCVVKELQEGENVLIGRPISGMSVYLTDSSGGLVPVGVAGEICIAGDGVGSGYLNRAELSAAKFIASPFRIGERMYRSGDLGRWTGSGELEFLGRSDEQVKIRGYRIELGEIESQLQGYAELSAAIVLAQPGSGGEQELVAYLVSDQELDIHSLRAYLGNLLPAYLIPAHFVQVDAIPLTSNGKADKKQLAAAGGLSLESGIEYIAPRNVTEEQVAQIWSEVLEKAQVGIRDDFFDLGGDSIKILRMMAGLRRELGVEVPIAEVYRNSTIEGLMAHIGSHEQELAEDQVRHQGEEAAIRAELEELKGRILSELEEHSDIEDVYPMSDIEKGMVFEFLVNKGAGVYHDQMVHQRIFFDFDAERFRYALELLVEKHTILRTSFHLERFEREVQMVHRKIAVKLDYRDLSELERNFQEYQVRAYLEEEMGRPFEVTAAPLWRMAAFNFGKGELIFVFQCHHAIIDGWSDALLMTELNNLYLQLGEIPDYRPAALASNYKDFIVAHELDKRNVEIRDFWQQELSAYTRLDIFSQEPELSLNRYHLDKVQLRRLEAYAKSTHSNVKSVSLSAYLYLLKLLNAGEDIVTGLVTHMRPNIQDSDQMLGCFLNTIPFRMHVSGQEQGTALVQDVYEKLILMKDKERLSMLEISTLHNKQSERGNPFFDVLFDYVDFHAYDHVEAEEDSSASYSGLSSLDIGGIDLTNTYLDFIINRTGAEFYELSIRLTHKLKSGLDADRLAGLYFNILDYLISSPAQQLNSSSHLSAPEQVQLLGPLGSGGAGAAYRPVLSLFTEQVNAHPEGIAVVDGERSLSYAELDRRSGELAAALVESYGVSSGSLVGIMQDRSLELVISILGVLKSGGAYVPVDPVYPASRKAYIMEDTGLTVLLTQTDYIFDLDYYSGQVFAVDAQLEGLSGGAVLGQDNLSTDLAYVIYTSGSTGQPKGCTLSHGNLSHYIQWANHYYFKGGVPTATGDTDKTAAGNFGLYTSLSFDLTVTSIFCALSLGSSLRVYAQEGELTEILRDSFSSSSGIDSIKLTPSHINLLQHLELESSSMLCAIVGGEAVSAAQVAILKKINPAIRIYNEYGPTETTVGCVVKELQEGENVLIGRPISGMSVYLTDSSGGLVPVGVAGEICIAGDGVGSGYLNRAELSAAKFIASPFRIGERMYRSGDLGRWTGSGELEFLGRSDEQVKIRGYRIELGEIESQLQGYAELSEAVVLAQPGSGGEQELVAYLVSDQVLDIHSLRAYLGNLLPAYLIPAHFVQVDAIPLTSNGKADKKQLAAAGGLSLESGTEYLAPRNATEEKLVEIWEEILGKTGIGVLDNFFDLGGHSLTAMRVLFKIRNEFKVDINMETVFNNSTIEFIAQEISRKKWVVEGANLNMDETLTVTI